MLFFRRKLIQTRQSFSIFNKLVKSVLTFNGKEIVHSINEIKQINVIRRSGLFDFTYYYNNYPDIANSGANGIIHYVQYGALEGRNPSNNFNTKIYLYKYSDVRQSKINPLFHYIKYGISEHRDSILEKQRKLPIRQKDIEMDDNRNQWESLFGDFEYGKDYSRLTVHNLDKESGWVRGEIVKSINQITTPVSSALLPGEYNRNKIIYAGLLKINTDKIVTAGLDNDVDYQWNFENNPPDFGKFDLIISQAMLEHLIDPYKHVRDLYNSLNKNGYLILHTVLPGFQYHRYPIDCMRFFPDWFEEVGKRLNLEVCDKYIGDLRIMYRFKKNIDF